MSSSGYEYCSSIVGSSHLLYFDMSTVDGEEALPELELVREWVGIRERDQRHFLGGRALPLVRHAGTAVVVLTTAVYLIDTK